MGFKDITSMTPAHLIQSLISLIGLILCIVWIVKEIRTFIIPLVKEFREKKKNEEKATATGVLYIDGEYIGKCKAKETQHFDEVV